MAWSLVTVLAPWEWFPALGPGKGDQAGHPETVQRVRENMGRAGGFTRRCYRDQTLLEEGDSANGLLPLLQIFLGGGQEQLNPGHDSRRHQVGGPQA